MQGVERTAFNRDRIDDRFEFRRGLQRDVVVGKKADGLSSCRQEAGDVLRIDVGAKRGQTLQSLWSERVAANRLDNAIEFEGPQGASMHRGDY